MVTLLVFPLLWLPQIKANQLPWLRIKETAVKEARIKRAWKGRRDDNMEREKRKSDEVLIVESKNGVC